MAEIIACPKCNRQLQVPEDYFGQLVQCPDCQHQFDARPPSSAVQSTPPPAAPPKSEPADAPRQARYENDADDNFDDRPISNRPLRLEPHHGQIVLILGILSICCVGAPITGIIAWILGHIDLKKIDAGQMDPEGRSQAQTGKVLGMISTILFLLLIVGYCLVIVFSVGAGVMNGGRRRRF
jgi:hypothetical protein